MTEIEKNIVIIYFGSAYSFYRDYSLDNLKNKAQEYLNEAKNKNWKLYGGGCALNVIELVLSEKLVYKKQKLDDIQKKVWLSMALAFEKTNFAVEKKVTNLHITRITASPPLEDYNYAQWVKKHVHILSLYINLIDGLEKVSQKNLYKAIFETN